MPGVDHVSELTSCPLCGNGLQGEEKITDRDTFFVHCSICGNYEIVEECLIFTDMKAILDQNGDRLTKWVKQEHLKGKEWPMIKTDLLQSL